MHTMRERMVCMIFQQVRFPASPRKRAAYSHRVLIFSARSQISAAAWGLTHFF